MSDGEINVDSIDGEVLTTANIVGQLYPQGEKGDKGDRGDDGFSPTVETSKVGKTTTIKITDAQGEHTATILDGADGQGSGDMRTEVYDVNQNGIVDDAERVNGHTVAKDVPADAKFTDTTYTAGTGIDITNGVITNTQTSAEWGNITGTLSDQADLQNALDDKADASDIPTKVSDLTNDSGFIDKDVNNLTNYDTSSTVNTKISDAEEVLIGGDTGIKAGHQLWVDTSDVTPYINSEISNEYGTAQNLGYSQEYSNAHNVVVSITEPTNKSKVWKQHGSKNIMQCHKNITSSETAVTITSNYTGQLLNYINVTKSSSTSGNVFIEVASFIFEYATGNYILNGCPSGGSDTSYQLYFRNLTTNTDISPRDEGDGATVSLTKGNHYALYLRLYSGATFTDKKFYPMLRLQTETDDTYEPYVQDKEYILNNNTYEEFTPQNEIYSTLETKIGTFLGKPLYRRVVVLPNELSINAGDWTGTSFPNNNIETIVNGLGIKSGDATSQIRVQASADALSIMNPASSFNIVIKNIVIEYTKTTD